MYQKTSEEDLEMLLPDMRKGQIIDDYDKDLEEAVTSLS